MANPWDLNWGEDQPQEAVQQPGGMTQGQAFVPGGDIMPWDQPWGAPQLRGPIQEPAQPPKPQPAPTTAPAPQRQPAAAPGYEESALDRWLGITPTRLPANKPNEAGEFVGDFFFRPLQVGTGEAI